MFLLIPPFAQFLAVTICQQLCQLRSIPPRKFPLGASVPGERPVIYIDMQELRMGTGPVDKHGGQPVSVSEAALSRGEDDEDGLSTSDTLITMCGAPLTMNMGPIKQGIPVALHGIPAMCLTQFIFISRGIG